MMKLTRRGNLVIADENINTLFSKQELSYPYPFLEYEVNMKLFRRLFAAYNEISLEPCCLKSLLSVNLLVLLSFFIGSFGHTLLPFTMTLIVFI